MDSERAKQIMESKGVIEVLFRGSPVWIESLGDNNTAEVSYLRTKEKVEAPIYLLTENNPIT